jgi:hypothetical protein
MGAKMGAIHVNLDQLFVNMADLTLRLYVQIIAPLLYESPF